jgi:hypothetical protein
MRLGGCQKHNSLKILYFKCLSQGFHYNSFLREAESNTPPVKTGFDDIAGVLKQRKSSLFWRYSNMAGLFADPAFF